MELRYDIGKMTSKHGTGAHLHGFRLLLLLYSHRFMALEEPDTASHREQATHAAHALSDAEVAMHCRCSVVQLVETGTFTAQLKLTIATSSQRVQVV